MIFDLVGLGEAMVAFLPDRIGPLRSVTTFERAMAGAECNVLIGATRLGLRCAFASRVGDDEFGAYIVETLRGVGVDVSCVSVDREAPTGIFFRERSALGHGATPVYYRAGSAASRIGRDDQGLALAERCRMFLTTGITALLSQGAHEAVDEALARAHRSGAMTVFDPNLRQGLWGSDRAAELLSPLVGHADIYIGGEQETRVLLQTDAQGLELARRVADHGPRHVIIKRAHLGAVAYVNNEELHQAPYPAAPADAIGAGDAFAAGYLAAYHRKRSAPDALRTGAVCGAAVCAAGGDWETFPRPEELERTLGGWKPDA
jgi:2-dehydro-3-deoxygluconokinase